MIKDQYKMNQDTFYQFVHGNYSSKPKSYILAIENKDIIRFIVVVKESSWNDFKIKIKGKINTNDHIAEQRDNIGQQFIYLFDKEHDKTRSKSCCIY